MEVGRASYSKLDGRQAGVPPLLSTPGLCNSFPYPVLPLDDLKEAQRLLAEAGPQVPGILARLWDDDGWHALHWAQPMPAHCTAPHPTPR